MQSKPRIVLDERAHQGDTMLRTRWRRRLLTVVLLVSGMSLGVRSDAQTNTLNEGARAYGFVGFSKISLTGFSQTHSYTEYRYGGGWERPFYRGLGIGVEGGYRHPAKRFDSSFNLFYQPVELSSGGTLISPFATGGVTVAWAGGDAGIGAGDVRYNFGAGVNLWFGNRFGPRVGYRRYGNGAGDEHDRDELRVGLTFRWP